MAQSLQLGIVGLSGTGARVAIRALEQSVRVVGLDDTPPSPDVIEAGIELVETLAAMRNKLASPRLIVFDVPDGELDEWLEHLVPYVEAGDLVGDLGAAYWADSMRRCVRLQSHGVAFVDVGVLSQRRGSRRVGAMIVGGDRAAYERLAPTLGVVCGASRVVYGGASGSGHFAREVLQGVESALSRSIAEGVELLQHFRSPLEVDTVIDVWMRELATNGFDARTTAPPMHRLVADALELEVVAPVIAQAIISSAGDHQKPNADAVDGRPSAKQAIATIAARSYDPRLRNIHGSYGFDIEGVGFWVIDVADGAYHVHEGRRDVDCLVSCSERDFVGIVLGEENAVTAMMRGAVRIEGDLAMARRLVGLPGSRAVHGYVAVEKTS